MRPMTKGEKEIADSLNVEFSLKKYTLSLPPSKNQWLSFGKGRVFTTNQFKEWKATNYWKLSFQKLKIADFKEDKIIIECYWFKARANQDCHNWHCALADLLKEILLIDDKWFLIRDMDFEICKENPRVEFQIYNLTKNNYGK